MIGAIENAIVARIAAASAGGTLGYTLGEVTSYGGQLDGNLATITKRFPAVWVAFAGEARPEKLGGGNYRHTATFTVLAAARNVLNEAATRKGSTGKVGSYQMIEDIRALVVGSTLGLAIHAVQPGPVRTLFTGLLRKKQVSIFALELAIAYDAEILDDPSALADFALFHADWDIPAHEGFTAVPVDPAEADATDDVIMETE